MNFETINGVECLLLKTSNKTGEMIIRFSSSNGYKPGNITPEKWIEIARQFMKGDKGHNNHLDLVKIYCQRPKKKTVYKNYIREIFVDSVR